jgi:hypothetical protein
MFLPTDRRDFGGFMTFPLTLALLVGLALLTLLSLVPFVGFVIALLAVLFGMGALVWALVRTREMPTASAM